MSTESNEFFRSPASPRPFNPICPPELLASTEAFLAEIDCQRHAQAPEFTSAPDEADQLRAELEKVEVELARALAELAQANRRLAALEKGAPLALPMFLN